MKKYLEAYEFYKRQYPNHIVLFHIGYEYCAFEDDSFVVSEANGDTISYNHERSCFEYCFYQTEISTMLYKLRNFSQKPVTTIEYRNSQGLFDAPKVKQILEDMEADY